MSKKHAPRRAAPSGLKTGDIRECIENAFHAAGGRDYLVGVAKRRPDVFCGLLGKIIPSELHMSVLSAYQAMPIPVEQRDPFPAVEGSPEILGDPRDSLVGPPLLFAADPDWL